jgi:hypothetical protein
MFDHPEYVKHFERLMCAEGETLDRYQMFFDLRPFTDKRREFNLKRAAAFEELMQRYGRRCQLQFAADCQPDLPSAVDHIIPLASARLNKEIKGAPKMLNGKKAPNESFGSNAIENLCLACQPCNSLKHTKFLERVRLRAILASRGF